MSRKERERLTIMVGVKEQELNTAEGFLYMAGVIPSMSRRGNGYDNAAMESFWSRLKRELVHRCEFASHAEAKTAIFEWIEAFYNRERLHSALGLKSPVDFETNRN